MKGDDILKIYTKTGDNLKTDTFGRRVFKDDLVIEVNGTIDELQSQLMVTYNLVANEEIKNILLTICNNLFTVGYDISSSGDRFSQEKVHEIEALIDQYDAKLPPLTSFIVPGLTLTSSHLHLARTIARRCERVIVKYALDNFVNYNILKYINRLSDLLFVLARTVERQETEQNKK
jgi:cob(I)alamin adenosyltransferase